MNGAGKLPYPEWQTPLQELILEFDPEKFREKMSAAEALILERHKQLHQSEDGFDERIAISDCLSVLRAIKREKLS